MSDTPEQSKATDYGLDQTKGILESFEYTDTDMKKIDDLKTSFDAKIKEWFDADIAEIWAKLEKQEDKNKLTKIQTELTAQLKTANDAWTKEADTIETTSKKLNETTKKALDAVLTQIETNTELKALMEQAGENDLENPEYWKLEEAAQGETEIIEIKVAEKMGNFGKLLSTLTEKFLGVSIVDMAKDPDSPYGGILRKFLGLAESAEDKTFSKDNLALAKNPFAKKFLDKQAELEKAGVANIAGIDQLKEEDKEANSIITALQKYQVCDGLKMATCQTEQKEMIFQAKNWSQVIFLRKYLAHTTLPEKVTELTDKFGQYLPEEFKGIRNNEYKKEEKTDFPGIVTVNSSGFEIKVKWWSRQEIMEKIQKGIQAEKDSKEKTK